MINKIKNANGNNNLPIPQIFVTFDYTFFKLRAVNRDINSNHLSKLELSIKTKDLSMYVPILINNDFEIIDGQHRFEILKALKKPIYYIIAEDYIDEDLILLNQNSKKWLYDDYVKFKARKGCGQAQRLLKDSQEFDVSCQMIMYLSKNTNGQFGKDILYSRQNSVETHHLFNEIEIFNKYSFYKQFRFVRAYKTLRNSNKFNFKTMKSRVKTWGSKLEKQASWRGYLIVLASLYNYQTNLSQRIDVNFNEEKS